MNLTASTLDFSIQSSPLKVAPKQLVFIDRNVPDYQMLMGGVLPEIATILINLDTDGIDQITRALYCYKNLTAIHIVSHGAPGSVRLGNGYLQLENIDGYTQQVNSWSKSLAPRAEILLYGCEVAEGSRGAAVIWWLGELTQARIVAKESKTGNAELGGDWDLDASVPLAFTPEVMAEYQGVLANLPGTSGNDNITGTPDDETITPLTGIDSVNGGAGTDTLVVDYSGTNNGGIGYDSIDAATGSGNFRTFNGLVVGNRVAYSNIENLNITGTDFNDDIRDGNGNDILIAGAGNDTLTVNGQGVDLIDGGDGIDNITLNVSTTTGNNTIDLNNASNILANGTELRNIEVFTNLTTGAGNDRITAKTGIFNDLINSGAGDDTIDAKDGNNTVNAGDGNDNVLTGIGNDTINGGDGNDVINSGTGVDSVNGGAGTDTLVVDYSGTNNGGIGYDSIDTAAGSGNFRTFNGLVVGNRIAYSNIEKFNITGTNQREFGIREKQRRGKTGSLEVPTNQPTWIALCLV